MKKLLLGMLSLSLLGCGGQEEVSKSEAVEEPWIDLSKRKKPAPIVTSAWREVVVSASDIEDFSRLWTEIGGFEIVEKNDTDWLLAAPGSKDGFIRIVKNENKDAQPARPATAQAWDTGCFWSIMMRAKNIPSIITDAKALGWEPLTELAFLEFGPSKLNVIVLTHMETGARVQLYERLTTPLPERFPEFKRMSRPFNIMKMVKDRDETYDFFQQVLGFETFYYGRPFVSKKPEIMPIDIPPELTTTVPYKAAILYPEKDMEWGRVEIIEVVGMPDGQDYSERCDTSFNGIIGVVYKVPVIDPILARLKRKGVKNLSPIIVSSGPGEDEITRRLIVSTPDGANIIFEDVN